MAQVSTQQKQQLPLNSEGACMSCKATPSEDSTLTCVMCATPWHVECLAVVPETMASAMKFECPDCSGDGITGKPAPSVEPENKELFARIREIEGDGTLSEREKARKRQELLGGKMGKGKGIADEDGDGDEDEDEAEDRVDVLGVLGDSFKCSYCMELPERPVTTPCGHNFCLKCFQKWIKQGKQTCVKCRGRIPAKMAVQPHINSTLVVAIRMAKLSRSSTSAGPQVYERFVQNQDRPDKAFATERAQRPGMANAASGRIFVTTPKDHFGPIPAENDPERNQGVLVGETWPNRMECRQWGVHYVHVAGINGKAHYGSQSVVISGGYEDDEDHGEWFIYTGSGGRDLTGNKRTNKEQTFDQTFKDCNQALRVSCYKGYPVRVVRSEKDKRSPYAPESGYRYDGVYRVEKCWRKHGIQGYIVCRYLFVRCDNEPAPWTSDECGDRPRDLPNVPELSKALDISERTESPSWDYDDEKCQWVWKKPPPLTEDKEAVMLNPEEREKARKVIRKSQAVSMKEKLLKGFSCLICKKVMNHPLTTPCAHNFCKSCLESAFAGQAFSKDRVCTNGRKLRSQKNIMKCPSCPTDISEFLQNPQVNRELMEVIEKLQSGLEKEEINGKEENDPAPVAAASELSTGETDGCQETTLKRKSSSASLSDEHEKPGDSKKSRLDAAASLESKAPVEKPGDSKKSRVDAADGLESKVPVVKPGDNNIPKAPARRGRGRPKGSSRAAKEVPKQETPDNNNNDGEAVVTSKNSNDDAEAVAEDGNNSPSSPLHLHKV